MSEKQITPMKKLSYNLRLLKQQLSDNFEVLELTETQSHSHNYKYTKGVKSDYILIFTSNGNKEINFAFVFNYKSELESDYTIDVTVKEKDGDIKTINKFSYIKFKEILNNMVSLGIRDKSIINFIFLLKDVKDRSIESVKEERERLANEYINNVKDSLNQSKEIVINECLSIQKEKDEVERRFKNSKQFIEANMLMIESNNLQKKANELYQESVKLFKIFSAGDKQIILNEVGYIQKKKVCCENVRKHQQKIRKIKNDIPDILHKECVKLIERELESFMVYTDKYKLEL